ncbi:phosphoesterase RecJ domain-containing protein [Eubacterium aggregans]|uniref:Phosphoesterase RecJ domain-containing protein n=1 Tax=Eubacterium aggregans TaxID=81409 RepID=A0A1H3Y843_9FIRM|nr:DHH family phosphoesterase [Eubacterium aggregans]SEA07211.1 phosphoesterase RecJ domain-containing protein [Eubacterium aggregans]
MNKVPQSILDTITEKENKSFLVLAHRKPDGDAIGSVITLGLLLKAMGKTVDYYIDTPVEDKLDFFPEIACFNQKLKPYYDVVCFLDCSTMDYAYRPEGGITAKVVMVIDHHRSNDHFGQVNFVEETAATGELVFRVAKALDIPLDYQMVEAVYTSISTDTGSFQFSNVTTDTHQILSELYRHRDNFAPLAKRLHSMKSYNQMKLFGRAIDSLELLHQGKIAWVALNQRDIDGYGGEINITDDIANIGVNVAGVILSVTVKERENGLYRVSLRSKTPYAIDVSTFAKAHDGGGHFRAAGLSYTGDLAVLQEEIIAFFNEQEVD